MRELLDDVRIAATETDDPDDCFGQPLFAVFTEKGLPLLPGHPALH
jgi:hypothetical protein